MIEIKKTHMCNVRNEPYAFVAYDWPPRRRTCVINVMSPTPLKPMIDTKRTHMRNVCNELYAFVAYDWHQEKTHA